MRDVFMIHIGPSGSVFVKTYDFFKYQDGFTKEWGTHWKPIVAEGIEDAREKACKQFPAARPYEQQAKP